MANRQNVMCDHSADHTQIYTDANRPHDRHKWVGHESAHKQTVGIITNSGGITNCLWPKFAKFSCHKIFLFYSIYFTSCAKWVGLDMNNVMEMACVSGPVSVWLLMPNGLSSSCHLTGIYWRHESELVSILVSLVM